jgi:hypothetical protein
MRNRFLLAVVLACGAVRAAEWVSVSASTDGKQARFVDVASIRVTGEIRRAWFKSVFPPHTMRVTSGPEANKWWRQSVERAAFNCSEETRREEGFTIYFADGTNGTDHARPFPWPWEPVTPDTVSDIEMKFVCAWKPK